MSQQQQLRDCCENTENRSEPVDVGNGLTKTTCQVCGASHYELEIDPGDMFGEGKGL